MTIHVIRTNVYCLDYERDSSIFRSFLMNSLTSLDHGIHSKSRFRGLQHIVCSCACARSMYIIRAWRDHVRAARPQAPAARCNKHHDVSKLTTRHIAHLRNSSSSTCTHQTITNHTYHHG